jgi:hypothetical protein
MSVHMYVLYVYTRGCFSRCAMCAAHTLYKFIPNVLIHARLHCAGELLSSPWRTAMLAPNIAVRCAELSQRDSCCAVWRWSSCAGWRETAVVDTGRRLPDVSTAFQDCCRGLVRRATGCHRVDRSLFVTVFYNTFVFRLYAVTFHNSTVLLIKLAENSY